MSCQDSVVDFYCSTEVASKKVIFRGIVLSEQIFMPILCSQGQEQ